MAESQADPSVPRNAGGSRPDPILIAAEAAVASAQQDQIDNAINRRIFETSLDLILVVDRRGTFIRVSPSALTILGYRPDEMVGRSAVEFLYHEDLENTRGEMRQARHGRLMRHFECRYVHKLGRVITLTWTGVWSEPEQLHFFIGRDVTDLKETERRLRQSERRFDDVAEVSGDWVWETDRDHRFTLLYGGSTDALAIRPEALLGLTRWEGAKADPETDEEWRGHKADLDAHRPFRQFRYAIRTAAGGTMFISASGKPVFDETGEFIGFRGTATDETVMMEARRRAEKAESLLQDAIESISEGFAIYDGDDRLVMCNKGYLNLFSDDAGRALLNIRYEDLLREGLRQGQYADAVGHEEAWIAERLREHREAIGASEHRLSDGRWVMVTKRRMSNGWIAGLRMDISALKAAQAALSSSEAQLKRAQHLARIGSFIRDPLSDVAEWSDEAYEIFGVSRETYVPSMANFTRMLHPDDRERVLETQGQLKQGGRPDPVEFRITRPDGIVRDIVLECEIIRGEAGEPRRLSGTFQDVTERRRFDERLRQAQKMEAIGQLTGGMAHDFNNILGVVVGYLELAAMRVAADVETSDALVEARAAAMRAAELTSRLLSFARQQTLQPRVININDLVFRMAALLRRTLGEGIVITVVPASGLWMAFADPSLVEDALLNLSINARDAMPNGGALSIETANVVLDKQYAEENAEVVPGRYVMLAVTDSGTGMPPEVIERAFQPFFTTKEVGKGSGLGLSMVYGTAKQSGGHLKIYSEVGHGTTVRLYLPRSVTDAEPDVASAEVAKSPLPGGTETILMVEDNVAMGHVTNRMLVGLGYRVLRVDDAAAALAVIDGGEAIDLLFTDMVMPGGMTGRELAEEVRKRRPELPVLFTSGYAGGGASNGKPTGEAINILAKPYRRQELARRIRGALDGTNGVGSSRPDP